MALATLLLTVAVSTNASSSLAAVVNTPNPLTADQDNPVAGGAVHTVQSRGESMKHTAVTAPLSPLSRTGDLSIQRGSLVRAVPDNQTAMSRATLLRAEKDITAINTLKAWKGAIKVIQWVMVTVSPIASVCPILLCLSLC